MCWYINSYCSHVFISYINSCRHVLIFMLPYILWSNLSIYSHTWWEVIYTELYIPIHTVQSYINSPNPITCNLHLCRLLNGLMYIVCIVSAELSAHRPGGTDPGTINMPVWPSFYSLSHTCAHKHVHTHTHTLWRGKRFSILQPVHPLA